MFGDIFAELADILGNHVGKEDMLGNMFLKMTCFGTHSINSLPNNNILDWSKMKASADNKINLNEKFNFGLGRVENIVGKMGKCWLPAFSPSSYNVFKTPLFQGR